MDLIDQAKRFIREGHPTELLPLLSDCVAARNSEGMLAVKLLAGDMYGGDTYNLLLKAPAAYCLLAWGQDGLKVLVENALNRPNSKNVTLAFRLLSSMADGNGPPLEGMFLSDSDLRKAVSHAVGDWGSLKLPARSLLNELMLSLEDDAHVAISAGGSLFTLALMDEGAIKNLSHALALRWVAVGPIVLSHYNDLLARRGDDESAFHSFFEDHPLLLHPRAFQVWGKPDFHGRLEPDFIIRTYDNRYVVVEIETPAKRLVTMQNQLSADATHAIRQVLQYQEYLRTHIDAASEAFPEFSTPAGLVVIGQESPLSDEQKAVLRWENQSRTDIRIVGFDTLADTAKATTDNVIHGIARVIVGARLP